MMCQFALCLWINLKLILSDIGILLKHTIQNWKQHTQFHWVCQWEIMTYVTSLTSPSPGLSTNLPSKRLWPLKSQRAREIMTYATSLTSPSTGLSTTLLSKRLWPLQSQRAREIMTYATFLTSPSPGLSATLPSKGCDPYSPKGPERLWHIRLPSRRLAPG